MPLSDLAGLTLQVGDQKGGTESLLRAAGQLNDLPYKVQFSTFTSGPAADRGRHRGQDRLRHHRQHPADLRRGVQRQGQGGVGLQRRRIGDQILVHADSPITSIADLRGKRIAVGKGSSAHGHILGQLNKAGLTPADVKLVFLQPADALSAFTQRQADAWAIWDPYTAQAGSSSVRSIGQAKDVTNGYWFGVASDQALADPKRNTALSDLLVRFEKAARWAQDHPDSSGRRATPPPSVSTRRSPRFRRGAACGCPPRSTTRWWPPSRS